MAKERLKSRLDDRFGGYVASFIAFSAITALWAFIVRGDDFYGATTVFGVALPATTIAYLVTMPLFGFIAGKWRYEAPTSPFLLGKALARSFNFIYSHLLIVLFTAAMVVQAFFGWNVDDAVRAIDDRLFDMASRFAPWLAAYLAGFNLGRATGLKGAREREAETEANEQRRDQLFSQSRAEPSRREPPMATRPPDAEHDAATATKPFAFKRDPALFNKDGNRRPISATTAQGVVAPDAPSLSAPASYSALERAPSTSASKPAALFQRADGAAASSDAVGATFQQPAPAMTFDRLR